MAEASTKVVYAALSGNVLVAVLKYGAALLSGSSAMLTEAVHSTADIANQLLLLIGNRRARAPADASHPFGYGLEIYFWTFVVAIMVLIAGGIVSLYEGIRHVVSPAPIDSPRLSLIVLALSALFEGASFSFGYRAYRKFVKERDGGNRVGIWEFIKLSKDPNLYESLLEDSTALMGVAIASMGVIGSAYLRVPAADGAASMAIGMLLVANSLVIARATRSLIAGEGAAPPLVESMKRALATHHGLLRISAMQSLQLGPERILVAITLIAPKQSTDVRSELSALTNLLQATDQRICEVFFRLT